MSSEQPNDLTAPEPRRRPGAGEPGIARPRQAGGAGQGAAELARAHGYDPDDPATWPGNAPEAAAGPAGAEPDDGAVMLTDAKAMRAMAHPVRMGLLELLTVHDTLTATQASEALGESPANCAFHLRTLAKYGWVREAGGGKGRERPWTLVNRTVTLDPHQVDPQAALAAGELGRYWLERWMDRTRRVFSAPSQTPGWDEATGWSTSTVFLTAEETSVLRAEVRRLVKRYERRTVEPARRPAGALPVEWAVFTSLVPGASQLTDSNSVTDSGASDSADTTDNH